MSLCICDMCKSAEIGYVNEPCKSCYDYEKFEFNSERFESEIRADERRKFAEWLVKKGVLGNRVIANGEITDYGKFYVSEYEKEQKKEGMKNV